MLGHLVNRSGCLRSCFLATLDGAPSFHSLLTLTSSLAARAGSAVPQNRELMSLHRQLYKDVIFRQPRHLFTLWKGGVHLSLRTPKSLRGLLVSFILLRPGKLEIKSFQTGSHCLFLRDPRVENPWIPSSATTLIFSFSLANISPLPSKKGSMHVYCPLKNSITSLQRSWRELAEKRVKNWSVTHIYLELLFSWETRLLPPVMLADS